jgi:hypothetical protein
MLGSIDPLQLACLHFLIRHDMVVWSAQRLDVDPGEHRDVSGQYQQVVAQLKAAMAVEQAHVFSPDRGTIDPGACVAAMTRWNGFWGPWVTLA